VENQDISIVSVALYATLLSASAHIYVPLVDTGAKAAADATREARRIVFTMVIVYVAYLERD
jgi:hypothetical protein